MWNKIRGMRAWTNIYFWEINLDAPGEEAGAADGGGDLEDIIN